MNFVGYVLVGIIFYQKFCYFFFLFVLKGDWKEHATRQCNVYRQEEIEKNQSDAREYIARYMHYFTRYQTHNQSLEFEGKLLEQVEQRKKEMQAEAMSYTEQQSIQKAFDVLQQCRRTLKYTYPFAYYLKRNNQSEIFEQNQADLEHATEILSGFLEREINVEQNIALKLMDQTRYCDKRSQILLDHCKHGYREHEWDGLDPY
jgi:ariadne-1